MAKTKFDNIKNRVLLVVIVFLLSYLLTALIDKEYTTWFFGGELSFVDYMIDFGVSLLISFVFVELSVFYSSWSFRLVSFTDKPYLRLFICAFLLLLFNNLTVWCFSLLINICFDEGLAFFHQGLYIFSVMATFVSYIYTDAQYMESSILAERQKKELEITLLKEKEHAAQMQLEVLKSQIDPHFMFNNFSILSELIVEDTALAEKFLDNLSKVYRYVIQNLKLSDTHGEDMRRLVEYMYRNNYRYRERFLLPYRDGYISVQVKNISHIALKERTTLIFLNDGASMNISYSLDELESQLNPDIFFRANRQYLLHIDSIRNVSNYFNSRLKIHMKKYPDTEIIVSRERASALKEWLDK